MHETPRRAKAVVCYSEDRLTLQSGPHGFRALLCRTANKSNMALFGAFGIFQMPNQNRVLVDMLAACRLVEPGAERIAADNAKLEGIIGRPHHTGRPVYISSKFREDRKSTRLNSSH